MESSEKASKFRIPKRLTCPYCQSQEVVVLNNLLAKIMFRFGRASFRCSSCGKRWSESP